MLNWLLCIPPKEPRFDPKLVVGAFIPPKEVVPPPGFADNEENVFPVVFTPPKAGAVVVVVAAVPKLLVPNAGLAPLAPGAVAPKLKPLALPVAAAPNSVRIQVRVCVGGD